MKTVSTIRFCLLTFVLAMGTEAAAQANGGQQYVNPNQSKTYVAPPQNMSKKPVIKKTDLYLGAGYTIGTFSGVTFVASGVYKNNELQVDYTLGLSKSKTLYWYGPLGDVDGALQFKRNSLEIKYGYQFCPWSFFAITPQAGFSYERLVGSQKMGSYDKGDGTDAWCAAVGVKFMATPVRHLNIFVAPEYKIPIRKNAYYEDVHSTLDKTNGGFAIHIGVLYSFQFKQKGGKK